MSTPNTTLDKRRIDVVRVFLHYVASVGDVERTALACDLDPEIVRKLAESEGWNDKIKRLTLASKGGGMQAGDFERLQNRALNWVQAHRLRQVLDEVITHYHAMSPEEIIESITVKDKENVPRISARFFSDLAKALETVQGMSYAALGDTVPERQAMTGDEKANTAKVHAALIAALNGPGVKKISSQQLAADASRTIDVIAEPVPKALPEVCQPVPPA